MIWTLFHVAQYLWH